MSRLLALSLYWRFLRCASTSKIFVLQTRVMMTNKEKAVTAGTVHGKIIKYSTCIVADFKENVKYEYEI